MAVIYAQNGVVVAEAKVKPYFAKPVGLYNNTGISWEEDKIKTVLPTALAGIGGFGFVDNLVPNGFSEINLQLTKFLGTEGGGTDEIISYKTSSDAYNDGMLVRLLHSPNNAAPLALYLANKRTSMTEVYYQTNVFPYNSLHEYKVSIAKTGTTAYHFKVSVDGTVIYDGDRELYNAGYWCPQFCLSPFYNGSKPSFYGLHTDEYIVMTKSYLYVDDERIFGFR